MPDPIYPQEPQEPAAPPSRLAEAYRASQSANSEIPRFDPAQEPQDDESLATQFALAIPRGFEGMVKGAYGFADFIAFDSLPDWKKRLLGQSTHWAPSLLEGLATYAIPGGVAAKTFGAAQKGAGWAARVSRLARGAAAGAVVDAVITDPDGGRLSDWAREAGVDWAVTDYLATDPDDSQAEARFKNMLEGVVPGVALDGVAEVFRAMRGVRNGKPVTPNAAPVRRALAAMWKEEFGYDHDQAATVEAFIDAAGLDRSKIRPAKDLPLTMREGLSQESRAFVRFAEDGTAFIGALKNPDPTSAFHELAHVARRQLFDADASIAPRIGLELTDTAAVAKWAGAKKIKGGAWEWSTAAEEKFAAGFERYLRDGVAPNKGLERLFEKVSTYFRRVYQKIQGTALDVEVSPEVAEVFGRVLSRGERLALASTEIHGVGKARGGIVALGRNPETKAGKVDLILYSEDGGLRQAEPEGVGAVAGAESPKPDSPFPGSLEEQVARQTSGNAYLYRAEIEPDKILTVPAGAAAPSPEALQSGGYLAWAESGSERVHLVGAVPVERMGQSSHKAPDLLNLKAPGLTRALAKDQDVLFQGARREGDAPELGNARFDQEAPYEPINLDRISSAAGAREAFFDSLGKVESALRRTRSLETARSDALQAVQEFADATHEAVPHELAKALLSKSADEIKRHADRLGAAREILSGMGRQLHETVKAATAKGSVKQATDAELVEVLRQQQIIAQVADQVRAVQSEIALALGAQRIRYRGNALDGREWIPPRPEVAGPKPGLEDATPKPEPSAPGEAPPPVIDPATGRLKWPKVDADLADIHKTVYLDDPNNLPSGSLKAIIQVYGGRAKVEKMVNQIGVLLDANPDGIPPIIKAKGWLSMVPEYYINSILSGPITHAVNLTSGVMTTIIAPIEKAIGNLVVGRPSQAGAELSELGWHVREAHDAVKLAALAARRDAALLIPDGGGILEGGQVRAISARGQGVEPDSLGGRSLTATGKVLNLPSRLLLTEDEMLKQLNYRAHFGRRLTEIAMQRFPDAESRAQWVEQTMKAAGEEGQFYSAEALRRRGIQLARKNGITPDQEPEWVAAYVRTHWDEQAHLVAVEARQRSRLATFTEEFGETRGEGGLTKGALGFSVRDSVRGISASLAAAAQQHPSLRLIFPFVRTPVNIMSWFMDRSVGVVSDTAGALARKEIRQAITKDRVADLAGRWATGSALITVAAMAASRRDENGLPVLTGAGPTDPDERRLWEATGWRPYSIRVNGNYVSYRRIDPSATFFGIVADLVQERAYSEMLNRQPEFGNAVMVAVVNNIASKTYLLGAVNFARAIGEPDRFGPQLLESFAGAAAPFSSAVHQAVNPLRGDSVLHEIRGVGEAFRSKWIGSDPTKLPVRRTVLGEPMERDKGIGGDPWSPLRYVAVKDDPLAQEMVRIGAGFQPPRETSNGVDWTTYRNEETGQNAYDRWMELHGQVEIGGMNLRKALERTVAQPAYQRMPARGVDDLDSPRVAALRRVVSRYREKARQQTFTEYPTLSSDARKLLLATHMMRSGQQVATTGVPQ